MYWTKREYGYLLHLVPEVLVYLADVLDAGIVIGPGDAAQCHRGVPVKRPSICVFHQWPGVGVALQQVHKGGYVEVAVDRGAASLVVRVAGGLHQLCELYRLLRCVKRAGMGLGAGRRENAMQGESSILHCQPEGGGVVQVPRGLVPRVVLRDSRGRALP
jgi:hypothetical protein